MSFRAAKMEEVNWLLSMGYKEWCKNRTFEKYCIDNGKEDSIGTRYVITHNDQIVSSAILIKHPDLNEHELYGIGSVVTPQEFRGRGYAAELLRECISLVDKTKAYILLYSDISPRFYEKMGFRVLPAELQKSEKSPCMAYCNDKLWVELLNTSKENIPDYF